jgi:hypothetical protein
MDLSFVLPYTPFLIILITVLTLLISAHLAAPSSTPFSIYDLIQDKETGKGSLEKVGVLLALLLVAYWFCNLIYLDKANWEDAIAVSGILGLAKFANTWLAAKYVNSPKA